MTMNFEIEPAPVDLEHKLASDNQHLQQTVGALRDRLERLRLEKDEAVQRAVAAMAGELEQLKATSRRAQPWRACVRVCWFGAAPRYLPTIAATQLAGMTFKTGARKRQAEWLSLIHI